MQFSSLPISQTLFARSHLAPRDTGRCRLYAVCEGPQKSMNAGRWRLWGLFWSLASTYPLTGLMLKSSCWDIVDWVGSPRCTPNQEGSLLISLRTSSISSKGYSMSMLDLVLNNASCSISKLSSFLFLTFTIYSFAALNCLLCPSEFTVTETIAFSFWNWLHIACRFVSS